MSFVKDPAESNEDYLESCKGDPWWPAIERAHKRLAGIDPNYQIVQIKEKFHGLRYYYDSTLDWDSPGRAGMEDAVREAELECEEIDRRREAHA